MTIPGPGPRNLITDVEGLSVGQAHDARARTGVTVILPDEAAVCAVDVRGGGPGTRETDALAPDTLVDAVHAVVFAGGSVYGLAAADGVCAWLGAKGVGYRFPTAPAAPSAPVVPAAILFDLNNGGDKTWGEAPPYRDLGRVAAEGAGFDFALGTAGAGYGAMAGALKGGVGSASVVTADGITVAALVCANPFGSVVVPGSRAFWAAPFEIGGEFGGLGASSATVAPDDWGFAKADASGSRQNTAIACVATNVTLSPAQAKRVAVMAQDGLARAIRPVHAPFDGDVVFALSTAKRTLADPEALSLARIGALAADTLARAVARAVFAATSWPDGSVACWRDLAD